MKQEVLLYVFCASGSYTVCVLCPGPLYVLCFRKFHCMCFVPRKLYCRCFMPRKLYCRCFMPRKLYCRCFMPRKLYCIFCLSSGNSLYISTCVLCLTKLNVHMCTICILCIRKFSVSVCMCFMPQEVQSFCVCNCLIALSKSKRPVIERLFFAATSRCCTKCRYS